MFVTKISMPYTVQSPLAFATAVAVAVSVAVAVAVAKLVHGKKRRKKSNCIYVASNSGLFRDPSKSSLTERKWRER